MRLFILLFALLLFKEGHSQSDRIIIKRKVNGSQATGSRFTFSLATTSKTSAGVFKTDGTLVRTLWSGAQYSTGSHTKEWDGLLDDGTPAPQGAYQVKVLSSNVNYQWEGVIGNTSGATTIGSTKLRTINPINAMCIVGSNMYCSSEYNEAYPSSFKVTTSNPSSKTWIGPLKVTDLLIRLIVSDSNYVYWAGNDPNKPNEIETFVYATRVSDDTRVTFSSGTAATMIHGSSFSGISYKYVSNSRITGLAVQKAGNYLFVARKNQNELQVLNKTTGAVAQTLTVPSPTRLAVDTSGNLWMTHNDTLEKYTVNSGNGSISTTGIRIIALQSVIGMSVSKSNLLAICEGGTSQRVRAYNPDGSSAWNMGQTGGHATNAAVANDKFYWNDVNREFDTFVTFQNDGSFWVGDVGNRRTQHYNTSRSYIGRIMHLPATYRVLVDVKDSTRVFADYLEFKVDYTKILDSSWTLVKNWGYNVPEVVFDGTHKLSNVVTLGNGKTYGFLRGTGQSLSGFPTTAGFRAVELPSSGLIRFTKVVTPGPISITAQGAYSYYLPNGIGATSVSRKYNLIGFDGDADPLWPSSPDIQTTTPSLTAYDPYLGEGFRGDNLTSSGKVIFFDYGKANADNSKGYHLSAMAEGGSAWLWKTAPTTLTTYTGPFPADGEFDSGNTVYYPGGTCLIAGQNIFWSYHGEFWKGSQTNKWNHVYDNGLFVGQFGEVNTDHPDEEAFAGGAGNTLAGGIVYKSADTAYVYHNDESIHAGVHRWRITGMSTISVQNAVFPSAEAAEVAEGDDLLAGLSRGTSMANGVAGWTRSPAADYLTGGENFSVIVGNKTFSKNDVFVKYAQNSGNASVIRSLGSNTGLTSWKLSGTILYDLNTTNEPFGNGGSYLEILDASDLVIARFYMERSSVSGTNIRANGIVMYNTSAIDLQVANNNYKPFEISVSGSSITFKYANYTPLVTTTKMNSSSVIGSPTKLRFYFFTNNPADNYTRSVTVSELRFKNY